MALSAEEAVAKLGDSDVDVRCAALEALRKLTPEDLATHAGAIVQRLGDSNAGQPVAGCFGRLFGVRDFRQQGFYFH